MIQAQSIGKALDQSIPWLWDEWYAGFLSLLIIPVLVVLLSYGLAKAFKSSNAYSVVFVSAFISILTSVLGYLIFGTMIVNNHRDTVEEAAHTDLLENLDITNVSILQSQGVLSETTPYQIEVVGKSQGEYVEFGMIYDAEFDLMMPIRGLDAPEDIPVKEGSKLAAAMVADDNT